MSKHYNPHIRGYHVSYRDGSTDCPGCGRNHWFVGRITAECAFCSTALPIEESNVMGISTVIYQRGKKAA